MAEGPAGATDPEVEASEPLGVIRCPSRVKALGTACLKSPLAQQNPEVNASGCGSGAEGVKAPGTPWLKGPLAQQNPEVKAF